MIKLLLRFVLCYVDGIDGAMPQIQWARTCEMLSIQYGTVRAVFRKSVDKLLQRGMRPTRQRSVSPRLRERFAASLQSMQPHAVISLRN